MSINDENENKRENILDEFRATELVKERDKIEKEEVKLSKKKVAELRETTDSDDEFLLAKQQEIAKKKNDVSIERAKKRVDEEVPAKILSSRPGYGLITAMVEIHTRQAYAFLLGRKEADDKPSIVGLFKAASAIKKLLQSEAAGCPFAVLKIEELEKAFVDFDEHYMQSYTYAKEKISVNRLKLKTFKSNRPAIQNMTFISSHAFRAADMLMRYDDLCRLTYPYFSAGLITKDEFFGLIGGVARRLRSIYSLPMNYVFVGPDHVHAKDAIYLMALKRNKVSDELMMRVMESMKK